MADDAAERGAFPATARLPTAGLPPHPPLPPFYGEAGKRESFVRALFDATAADYDRLNRLFSLGAGVRHRRRALIEAGLGPGMRVLDVAVGTGLTARAALPVIGGDGTIVGLDVSEGMLREARRQIAVPVVLARMECLPFAEGSMDFVSLGYALRHVGDLRLAFGQFLAVLRPGGVFAALEIRRPRGRFSRRLLAFYIGRFLPVLCRLFAPGSESGTLMRYYWETIARCAPSATIVAALTEAGFTDARCVSEFDCLCTYIGRKPLS